MHSKNRLWSCLNDLQVLNVGNGGWMSVIESNRNPLARYVDDCGGVKSAPQDLRAFAHSVVPHKINAVNTRARINPMRWSFMFKHPHS
jgi:hypothetical protein